jgi:hypothetical protein
MHAQNDVTSGCVLALHIIRSYSYKQEVLQQLEFGRFMWRLHKYLKLTHNGKVQIYEACSTYERIKKYLQI